MPSTRRQRELAAAAAFERLPDEVLVFVSSCLGAADLGRLACAARKFALLTPIVAENPPPLSSSAHVRGYDDDGAGVPEEESLSVVDAGARAQVLRAGAVERACVPRDERHTEWRRLLAELELLRGPALSASGGSGTVTVAYPDELLRQTVSFARDTNEPLRLEDITMPVALGSAVLRAGRHYLEVALHLGASSNRPDAPMVSAQAVRRCL